MKKILILIILTISVFGESIQYELKLYEKVITSLFRRNRIDIYCDDKIKSVIQKSDKFNIVTNCDDAILKIGSNLNTSCLKLPLFATTYKSFRDQQNVIGAFYWRKGRPQLKLKKSVLDRYQLTVPKSLIKYVQ